MNGKRRDWVRNERPRDPQGMEPDGRGETDIMTLVARIEDLNRQAALELTRNQIQSYLKQLRADELIHPSGPTRSARWFSGPRPKARRGGQDK